MDQDYSLRSLQWEVAAPPLEAVADQKHPATWCIPSHKKRGKSNEKR